MTNFPEVLTSGEAARLIPVAADSSKEIRAASVLLASMTVVDNLSRALLGGVGIRIGARTNVQCFTEVVLKELPGEIRLRPDGLIRVITGKREWTALVEAKIGRAELSEDQIIDYVQLAKLNGIEAVITLSNQFAALPTHHPVQMRKATRKGVDLFHWSWMHVLTQATLLLAESDFSTPEQRYVLEEMVRYFKHESVGVFGFDRMNPEWKELVGKVQSGASLYRSSPEITNSVAAWHQESRDLCLIMSRKLGRDVSLKLSNAHKKDPARRLKDDSEELVQTATLHCVLDVPDTATPITIFADLRRRTVSCGMRLEAPKDRKRSSARINWMLRQLSSSMPENLFLTAFMPGRAKDMQASLSEVRENPLILDSGSRSLTPQSFEVLMIKDLAGKFSGRVTFIEHVEHIVPEFYEQVAQYLRAWVPPPPKIKEERPRSEQQSFVQEDGPKTSVESMSTDEKKEQQRPPEPSLPRSARPWYRL